MKLFLSASCLALLAACTNGSVGNPPPNGETSSQPLRISHAVQSPPPRGWQFPYHPDPFDDKICKSDPCHPQIDPNSASEVSQVMNGTFSMGEIQEAEPGTKGEGQDDTDPIYYATRNDPTYAVTCSQFGGCGFLNGVAVHIPDGARASIDSDHHATVIERWAGTEFDFWEFNDYKTGKGTTDPVYGGGSVSVGFGGMCVKTSLKNLGRCDGSGNEAAMPYEPGLLDPREIVAGRIRHTFFVGTHCPSPLWFWPAAQSGGRCSSGPAEGERIWLDLTDAQINALPDHAWAKTLLHAMHDYGMMIDDTAGSSPWVPEAVDNATFTIVGQKPAWDAFFTEVEDEGDGGIIGWGDDSSHLPIPTTGITQSNIHIIE